MILKLGETDTGTSDVTIEHWAPQHPSDGERQVDPLDYRNMLAVCDGNRGSGNPSSMTCDASKGSKRITVNPLQKETLADIYYTSAGEIHSRDKKIEEDLTGTLNLNCEAVSLPQLRKSTLQEFKRGIQKRYSGRSVPKSYLLKALNHFESSSGRKDPYVGVIVWWIEQRLKRG